MKRILFLLVWFALPALPQRLTIGVTGGLRLTGDTPQYGVSNSRRYLIGPMIEVGLPLHFAIEFDALYSRLGNTMYFASIGYATDMRTIANSWEFPIVAKYRLPVSRVNPFVGIGVAPRHASGKVNSIQYGFYPGDVGFYSSDWHARDHALVVSGGVGVGIGHLRIMPEFRYLRWNVPSSPWYGDVAYYLQLQRKGEVQLLLGVGWSK